jgi:hypothetical protein
MGAHRIVRGFGVMALTGGFPGIRAGLERSAERLRVTAVLFELHDEWIAFPRRYLPEGSEDQIYPDELPETAPALPGTTNAPTQ